MKGCWLRASNRNSLEPYRNQIKVINAAEQVTKIWAGKMSEPFGDWCSEP